MAGWRVMLTQNLWKLPLGYNPLTWIMERHHYTHWFLQIQFSQRRKQVTSNAWSMRRIRELYTLRQCDHHIPCIILLYITISWKSVHCSLLYVWLYILSLTMVCVAHYSDVRRDTMTTLNCVTPPPGRAQLVRWSKLPPSIMYNACISTYLHHLQPVSVATMSWNFRTFLNKGNVRMIITQMLEWKQRSRWIHAHVSRFLFIVLWIIKRLTPPKAIKASCPKETKWNSRILKTSWMISSSLLLCQHVHFVACRL